jgi:hypothetical protein
MAGGELRRAAGAAWDGSARVEARALVGALGLAGEDFGAGNFPATAGLLGGLMGGFKLAELALGQYPAIGHAQQTSGDLGINIFYPRRGWRCNGYLPHNHSSCIWFAEIFKRVQPSHSS